MFTKDENSQIYNGKKNELVIKKKNKHWEKYKS